MSDEMVTPTPDSPAGASDSNLGGAFADFIQDAAGPGGDATGALNAETVSNASPDDVINELLGLEGDKPGNVPYERFREVNERAKQADATSSELGQWKGVIDELRAQGFNSAADVQKALAEQQAQLQEQEIRDRYERLQEANIIDAQSAYAQQEAEITRLRYERQMGEVQQYMLDKQMTEAITQFPLAKRSPDLVASLVQSGINPAQAAEQVHNIVKATAQALLPDLTNRLNKGGAVTPMSSGRTPAPAVQPPAAQRGLSTITQLLGISKDS